MKTTASTKAHQPRAARRRTQESRILEHIKFLPQTLKSLHEITGIDKSTIAARLSALQERGVVTGFDTVEVSNGKGQLVTVTLYDYEPDEHRQIDHAHARRRNLAIARIESSLKNDLEFLPQALVANMHAFLETEKELGQLSGDYKQPKSGGKCDATGCFEKPDKTCDVCNGHYNNIVPCPKCGGLSESLFDVSYEQPEAPRPPDKFKPL